MQYSGLAQATKNYTIATGIDKIMTIHMLGFVYMKRFEEEGS